jgi:hypothetical protein
MSAAAANSISTKSLRRKQSKFSTRVRSRIFRLRTGILVSAIAVSVKSSTVELVTRSTLVLISENKKIVVPKKGENRFNTLNSNIGQQVIKEDSEESKSDVEGQTQVETASRKVYAKSKTSRFNLSPLNCDTKDNLSRCLEYSPTPTGVDSNSENSTSPHRLSYWTAAMGNESPPRFKKDAQPKPHEISTPGKSEIDEQKAQTRPRFSQQLPGKELLRIPENSILENSNNYTCGNTSFISIHHDTSKPKIAHGVSKGR